jgi:hypothetical protein
MPGSTNVNGLQSVPAIIMVSNHEFMYHPSSLLTSSPDSFVVALPRENTSKTLPWRRPPLAPFSTTPPCSSTGAGERPPPPCSCQPASHSCAITSQIPTASSSTIYKQMKPTPTSQETEHADTLDEIRAKGMEHGSRLTPRRRR